MGIMKTTVELPDDLVRAIKLRAVVEDKKLKDLIEELLRFGLRENGQGSQQARHRVKLPLVEVAHEAVPGDEPTPERVAQFLIDEEADWAIRNTGT
jgi:hypothetical protein